MFKPLLHFLALGLLLWAAQAVWEQRHRGTVTINEADIAQLQAALSQETRQPPDPTQLEAAIQQRINEEVMLAEALRWDLHRHDKVTRQRLLKNLRFAWPDTDEDPDTLLQMATALQMPQRDPVARGRLLQLMRIHLVRHVEMTPDLLREYRDQHPDRYQAAPRMRLEHVFFRAERPDARRDAKAALAQLAETPERQDLGDPFPRGHDFEGISGTELQRLFGSGFAKHAEPAGAGWHGPVSSVYGQHLLRVSERTAPVPTNTGTSESALRAALEPELRRRALDQALQRLRRYYRIEVASL